MFFAPFDVRLNADTFDNTVVLPDIMIFCDDSKLDDKGGKGAPDMAVEVLSPSSVLNIKWINFGQCGIIMLRRRWTPWHERERKQRSVARVLTIHR